MLTTASLDQIAGAEKEIVGAVIWRQDSTKADLQKFRVSLKINLGNLQEIHRIEFRGQASIYAARQRISLVLLCASFALERMNFLPNSTHTNIFGLHVPPLLAGRHFRAGESRFYSWANDRKWPRPPEHPNVDIAEPIETPLDNVEAAVRYFLTRTHIRGELPLPPYEPRLV